MIVYLKCACTTGDRLWVMDMRNQGHDVRTVNKSQEWRKEAAEYKTKLPFVVLDEKKRIAQHIRLKDVSDIDNLYTN